MRIAVGIPTSGRAAILAETLAHVAAQTRRADRIIVCGTRAEDFGNLPRRVPAADFVHAESGLTRQRNCIIDHAEGADLLLFLDDDFLMREDYVAAMEDLFATSPGTVAATGTVLRDGAQNAGLSPDEGRAALAADRFDGDPRATHPVANAYGCNMALRLGVVERHRLRFDERLPLYGWQEDADFCCRLGAHGTMLRLDGARGVHLGAKGGRASGLCLGYSQVVNPIYIARRVPAYTARRAASQVARNLAANLLRAAWPEPWVDRRGRLRGNLAGLLDLLRGRAFPERMLLLAGHRAAPGAHDLPQGYYGSAYGGLRGPADRGMGRS